MVSGGTVRVQFLGMVDLSPLSLSGLLTAAMVDLPPLPLLLTAALSRQPALKTSVVGRHDLGQLNLQEFLVSNASPHYHCHYPSLRLPLWLPLLFPLATGILGVVDLLLGSSPLSLSPPPLTVALPLVFPHATGILGVVDLLLGSSPLTSEQRTYAHTIRESGEKLLAVLSSILDSCRVEPIQAATAGSMPSSTAGSGNIPASCQVDPALAMTAAGPFSLHETVRRAVGLSAGAALSQGVRVTSHIASGVPDIVEGDSQGVFHLLCCLTSAAVPHRCVTTHSTVV